MDTYPQVCQVESHGRNFTNSPSALASLAAGDAVALAETFSTPLLPARESEPDAV